MQRVKYIYDHKFYLTDDMEIAVRKVPVACVVSEDGNFGVSICCKCSSNRNGDTFSKKRAKGIAYNRMMLGTDERVPNRKITNRFGDKVYLSYEIDFWVDRMTADYQVVS